jgi:hypothetical protein
MYSLEGFNLLERRNKVATWFDRVKEKKKDDIPEVFKDKSEDDILKMMKDAAGAQDQVKELLAKDARNTETVERIKTEFEVVKERLRVAEAKAAPPAKKPDEEHNFVEHPDEAFAERNAPTLNLTIQTAATTARMLAQQNLLNMDASGNSKDGRLFQMWSAEIDAESRKYPAPTLTNINAWLGIFYYLKGIHADELRDPETRKKKYSFLEPAASSEGRQPEPDGKPKTGSESLTDAEKHVADKMHVSYEAYAKRKAAMNISGA